MGGVAYGKSKANESWSYATLEIDLRDASIMNYIHSTYPKNKNWSLSQAWSGCLKDTMQYGTKHIAVE